MDDLIARKRQELEEMSDEKISGTRWRRCAPSHTGTPASVTRRPQLFRRARHARAADSRGRRSAGQYPGSRRPSVFSGSAMRT
jgi:hypothetical protein